MFRSLSNPFSRLWRDRSGNIAILAGITLPVLALVTGVAVDYGNAVKVRAKLQSAADAGVLAAAIHLNQEGDDAGEVRQAKQDALQVMRQNVTETVGAEAGSSVQMQDFSAEDGVVSFAAKIDNKNYFSGIVGADNTEVGIGTQAIYGGDGQLPVRVALVLDNSGSMAGTKLNNLKTAAKRFVDILEEADDKTDEDEVNIGVVPFSTYVNVGTQYRNAPWIDVRAENVRQEQRCWQPRKLVSRTNCRTETYQSCSTNDGNKTCQTKTRQRCDDTWENDGPRKCEMRTVGAAWEGCITTRRTADYKRPYYKNEEFIGLPRLECPGALQTLTSNYGTVRSMLNGMKARGNTMIAQGVQWGRILLDAQAPFPVKDEKEEDLEYLVIMTDGNNTVERDHRSANDQWSGERVGIPHKIHVPDADADDVDDDTIEFCQAARDAGVKVMTIAFDVSPGSDAYRIMQACASESDLFFAARNANDLRDAFKELAQRINRERFKVRLSG